MKDFDLGHFHGSCAGGLDALFEREKQILSPHKTGRSKISSIKEMDKFIRLSSDTLIHKCDRDLWSLKKEGENYYVERLFDDNGEPLRG